jgi:hypothetical protein
VSGVVTPTAKAAFGPATAARLIVPGK